MDEVRNGSVCVPSTIYSMSNWLSVCRRWGSCAKSSTDYVRSGRALVKHWLNLRPQSCESARARAPEPEPRWRGGHHERTDACKTDPALPRLTPYGQQRDQQQQNTSLTHVFPLSLSHSLSLPFATRTALWYDPRKRLGSAEREGRVRHLHAVTVVIVGEVRRLFFRCWSVESAALELSDTVACVTITNPKL